MIATQPASSNASLTNLMLRSAAPPHPSHGVTTSYNANAFPYHPAWG